MMLHSLRQKQPIAACKFETLSAADVEAIAPLYLAVFNAPPWQDGWTLEATIERLASYSARPEFFGLSLWSSDTLIGFALGCAERGSKVWHFHLYEMCVAPGQQGLGYGRVLLNEMERQLHAKGQSVIVLQTGAKVPARRFYEACGYVDGGLVTMKKRYVG
jgi:aminoglycoside 6'-N-acetyltransferase I